MAEKLLEINLFGACIVRSAEPAGFEITGAKHRALFVLLATAPFGRRTRSFLQDTLWGTSCYDSGRQSLRRALSDIKATMGPAFEQLLTVNNAEVSLDLSQVHFIGRPGGGEFLEGIDIRDNEFNDWLRGVRMNPGQLDALFSVSAQPPPPSILPSIAILPFRPVFGTSESATLGDWLAEEVSRSLSRSNLLAVISHLSSRRMAATSVDFSALRMLLGVDYCVSGSLRLFGDTAVLDTDFIDTASGRILWTRQAAGTVAEFLSPDSAPVAEIVRTVGRTIASDALTHVRGRPVTELADHELLIAGVGLMHEQRIASFARSRELLDEALRRAPRAAEAHAWMGEWYVMAVFNGWSNDRRRDTQRALDSTARALDIEPGNAFCLTIDGVVHNNLLQRLDVAEDRFAGALDVNPNESMAWLLSGVLSAYRDQGVQAVTRVEKAIRLSPLDPFGYFFESMAATAHLAAENFDRALDYADRSLARNPRHLSTLRARIAALHFLGRPAEARQSANELMRLQPEFTVEGYRRSHPAAEFPLGRNVVEALSASGVP
jgi:TolB-like protein/Tfp pilus assembly protein PilF